MAPGGLPTAGAREACAESVALSCVDRSNFSGPSPRPMAASICAVSAGRKMFALKAPRLMLPSVPPAIASTLAILCQHRRVTGRHDARKDCAGEDGAWTRNTSDDYGDWYGGANSHHHGASDTRYR